MGYWNCKKHQDNLTDVINMINLWRNNPERIFDFNEFKHYFDDYSIEEIYNTLHDSELPYLGELRIVRDIDYIGAFYLTPNNEGFTVLDYGHLDITDREMLEWIISPVYYYKSGNEPSFENGWSDIFKLKWEETDNPTGIISISAITDFYEKHKLWPHFKYTPRMPHVPNKKFGRKTLIQKQEDIFIPYLYFGDLILDGRKAYMFFDVDWEGSLDDIMLSDYSQLFSQDGSDALIVFEGEPFPDWVHMLPLSVEPPSALTFSHKYDEHSVDINKRFELVGPIFKTVETCQDIFTEPLPFKPLLHIPVINYNFENKPYYGDYNSLIIFWDGHNEFKSYYNQT
jgi:hypothetical protein